jgi:hypothetical protein
MAAWLLCQQYGIDLNSMDSIPKEEYVSSWVWAAHRSFCMMRYRKPMSYEWMKRFISRMRKSEWDIILKAMTDTRAPESEDKKKVQPGENSSSQDGRQD